MLHEVTGGVALLGRDHQQMTDEVHCVAAHVFPVNAREGEFAKIVARSMRFLSSSEGHDPREQDVCYDAC